jgi:hypothetical protein
MRRGEVVSSLVGNFSHNDCFTVAGVSSATP